MGRLQHHREGLIAWTPRATSRTASGARPRTHVHRIARIEQEGAFFWILRVNEVNAIDDFQANNGLPSQVTVRQQSASAMHHGVAWPHPHAGAPLHKLKPRVV